MICSSMCPKKENKPTLRIELKVLQLLGLTKVEVYWVKEMTQSIFFLLKVVSMMGLVLWLSWSKKYKIELNLYQVTQQEFNKLFGHFRMDIRCYNQKQFYLHLFFVNMLIGHVKPQFSTKSADQTQYSVANQNHSTKVWLPINFLLRQREIFAYKQN